MNQTHIRRRKLLYPMGSAANEFLGANTADRERERRQIEYPKHNIQLKSPITLLRHLLFRLY